MDKEKRDQQHLDLQLQVTGLLGRFATGFDQTYKNTQISETIMIDIETDFFLIAIYTSPSGAETIIEKYKSVNDVFFQSKKKIILFAPNYTDTNSIEGLQESMPLYHAKSITDLFVLLK